MAQVVIPLVVLGTAYLVSNINSKEGNQNMNETTYTHGDDFPNATEIEAEINEKIAEYKKNNPNWYIVNSTENADYKEFVTEITNEKSMLLSQQNKTSITPNDLGVPKYVNLKGTREYREPDEKNVYQDKYFNKDSLHNQYQGNPEFVSLTGETVNSENVRHNNMQPFFSSKMSGSSVNNHNVNESILDSYLGTGTYQIEKMERGPLFTPETNVQNVYGVQNTNDFYQSRVVPSQRVANVKPWQEQRVAPGINQGYNTEGDGGFNSGMGSRESWMPKNVNDLRIANNPKETYTLNNHQGPALNPVKEIGKIGHIEKRRPDTYYMNNPDRWFTTTGAVKEQTIRTVNDIPENNRNATTVEYYGAGGREDGNGGGTGYVPEKYEPSKKITLPSKPFLNLTAEGMSDPSKIDYGNTSYKLLRNNRSTTRSGLMGNAYGSNGVLESVMNPIINTLRHTRKENIVGNIRETGNFGTSSKAPTVYNIQNMPRTNREMTEHKLDCTHLNYEGQIESGYLSNKQTPIENQRQTTNYQGVGNVGGSNGLGLRPYDAEYGQRNNNNKSFENRPNMGGMSLFNPYENINCTPKEMENTRANVATQPTNVVPSADFMGSFNKMPSEYEDVSHRQSDASLLDAFRNNPYTQPLNSIA
tara:strand:- start:7703 stop:9634 length:1932 start_codon:yes stop_codon:yes gene_type:complete